jgi:hypothetical protein
MDNAGRSKGEAEMWGEVEKIKEFALARVIELRQEREKGPRRDTAREAALVRDIDIARELLIEWHEAIKEFLRRR